MSVFLDWFLAVIAVCLGLFASGSIIVALVLAFFYAVVMVDERRSVRQVARARARRNHPAGGRR